MLPSFRNLRRFIAVAGSTALLATGGAVVAAAPAWAAATIATRGSGANLPYTEVQAENSATNGTAGTTAATRSPTRRAATRTTLRRGAPAAAHHVSGGDDL